MLDQLVAFLSLLFAALVEGSMFGLWLGLNPAGTPPSFYLRQHQQLVRGFNVVMPIMGATAMLFTAIAAVAARADRGLWTLLVTATVCLAATGWITRFRNQPLNAIVMTWRPEAVPPNWTVVRDAWWRWHVARVGLGMIALCALIVAALWR